MWIANHFLKNFACPNSKEFLRVILGVILRVISLKTLFFKLCMGVILVFILPAYHHLEPCAVLLVLWCRETGFNAFFNDVLSAGADIFSTELSKTSNFLSTL